MSAIRNLLECVVPFAVRGDPTVIVDAIPWLLVVFVLIGLGAAAVYFLRFLRHWQFDDPADPETLRTEFRELHRQGKLTAEEYREVQVTLAEQAERRREEAEAQKRAK